MPINSVVPANTNQAKRFTDWSVAYKSDNSPKAEPNSNLKKEKNVKYGVLLTSILGVAAALAVVAKIQKFSLSPSRIMKIHPKDWAIFKMKESLNGKKTLEIGGAEVFAIAGGSVIGGLVGGEIFDDKKHMKAKLREAVSQYFGTVSAPLLCVLGAAKVVEKFKDLSKNPSKNFKTLNNWAAKMAGSSKIYDAVRVIAGAIALGVGIIAGNKISNFLNEKIFKKEVDRNIKATDFAPHVDDVGVAITMMSPESWLGKAISRIIPLALIVPGYEVGIAKEGQSDKKH